MSKKGKIIFWAVIAVLAVAIVTIIITQTLHGGADSKGVDEFLKYIENTQYVDEEGNLKEGVSEDDLADAGYKLNDDGKVVDKDNKPIVAIREVKIDGYKWTGYTKVGGRAEYFCYGYSLYSGDGGYPTIAEWRSYGVSVSMSNPNSGSWVSTAFSVLSLVAVCVIFFLIIRSSMGGAGKVMSFAKTKARISTNIKVRFSDVAGAEEEKVELAEIVEFLRQPKKFSDLGARIPKGVLLVGHPGTGKTLFAKAVAGEAGVPFFSVSGSDFVEMYVGVGASRVRDLFDMAKNRRGRQTPRRGTRRRQRRERADPEPDTRADGRIRV